MWCRLVSRNARFSHMPIPLVPSWVLHLCRCHHKRNLSNRTREIRLNQARYYLGSHCSPKGKLSNHEKITRKLRQETRMMTIMVLSVNERHIGTLSLTWLMQKTGSERIQFSRKLSTISLWKMQVPFYLQRGGNCDCVKHECSLQILVS